MLARDNRKPETVIADQGERWNVAPALLSRVVDAGTREAPPEPGRGG